MNKKEYSSAIKKTPFNYLDAKIIAGLMEKGLIYDAVYKECFDKNLVNVQSLQRRGEVINVVHERLQELDSFLLSVFLHGSITTSKFLLVYAIAKDDRLFSEFLLTVYREAILGEKHYISIADFDDFFASAKEKNAFVAKWAATTIRDLSTGYRNILVESGLCARVKKNMVPRSIIVDPAVFDHIKAIGDQVYLQAILGVK
jgi:hypothetical protein